ncbi:MAG TPA: LytR C-terminal domain-containing protein, partial [Thermoleophilaceae bacterium]|nr:LytR C-terminal domain-containing protein [Thermoleophilaceae bacterium]
AAAQRPSGQAGSGQRSPVRPMLPPRPMPQQQTAIIPPPRQPWYRRLLASPRYLVLVVAGVLIFAGAAAFGVSELTSDDTGGGGTPAAGGGGGSSGEEQSNGDEQGGAKRAPIDPANVTVAVLNGTTVPNLAKSVGEQVTGKGFQLGTVANTADQDQQRAESVVLFSPGHRDEAKAVSRRLGIAQRQPIDPGSQGLAGDATVVIIAGADLAQ